MEVSAVKTLLVPLDGSAFGEYALPLALSIAQRAGADVELIHVCTPRIPSVFADGLLHPAPVEPPIEMAGERAQTYLGQLAARLSQRWDVPIRTVVRYGLAADTLYAYALASAADLVVMTTHGHGPLARIWMGSVADRLIRLLPMPLLLTRPHDVEVDLLAEPDEPAWQHVLIPLDGSALSEEILHPALALGRLMGARYTLLYALDPLVAEHTTPPYAVGLDLASLAGVRECVLEYLEQIADRLRAQSLQVQTQLVVGSAHTAILDYTNTHEVDLIAMTTHGCGGVARMLLGSVADKVVRSADVPILLQRPGAERTEPSIVADPAWAMSAT
jgi:nucleotide-binding universal stress UspA family protein